MALINTLTKNGNNSSMSDGVQREDLKVLIKALSGISVADISIKGAVTVQSGSGSLACLGSAVLSGTVAMSNASISMTALPTTDPAVAGRLWNNSGVVTVSAG